MEIVKVTLLVEPEYKLGDSRNHPDMIVYKDVEVDLISKADSALEMHGKLIGYTSRRPPELKYINPFNNDDERMAFLDRLVPERAFKAKHFKTTETLKSGRLVKLCYTVLVEEDDIKYVLTDERGLLNAAASSSRESRKKPWWRFWH